MYEEIQPLHEKQYEILKELKRVCDKNGLTYYLAFGTLLGAIRHKGFIPWDDDIDIAMRQDNKRNIFQIFYTTINYFDTVRNNYSIHNKCYNTTEESKVKARKARIREEL